MTIKKIIKFQGNDKYISCLVKDEDDDFYIVFGRTSGAEITRKVNSTDYFGIDGTKLDHMNWSQDCTFTAPLVPHNGEIFSMFKIKDESEFNLINEIFEVAL